MSEFELVGTVNNGLTEYEVRWVDRDLVKVELEGDPVIEFCSKNSGGFTSVEDVLDQAQEIVLDLDDFEVWDSEEDFID